MIKEKEFLDALNLIKRYQVQISEQARMALLAKPKTPIDDFLKKYGNGMMPRLYNGLRIWADREPMYCIEDIVMPEFFKRRLLGVACWREFIKLRGK